MILDDLNEQFRSYCRKLGVERHLQTKAQHNGSAHVEYANGEFYYVVTERGSEFERRSTQEPDTVLYWFVSDVVFEIACAYATKHRPWRKDFRRKLFEQKLILMNKLNPTWAARMQAEIDAILLANPYVDR